MKRTKKKQEKQGTRNNIKDKHRKKNAKGKQED